MSDALKKELSERLDRAGIRIANIRAYLRLDDKRTRIAALEKEATARGFGLIAHEAAVTRRLHAGS